MNASVARAKLDLLYKDDIEHELNKIYDEVDRVITDLASNSFWWRIDNKIRPCEPTIIKILQDKGYYIERYVKGLKISF